MALAWCVAGQLSAATSHSHAQLVALRRWPMGHGALTSQSQPHVVGLHTVPLWQVPLQSPAQAHWQVLRLHT